MIALTALTPLAVSDTLQPHRHVSPAGRATLSVDPLDREGASGAEYAVTVDGASAWSARLGFALWEAAVADDGRVAGCYFAGYRNSTECPMHVVLLSPAGTVLFDEAHPRDPGVASHGTPTPGVVKVCLQPELERFLVYATARDERAVCVYDLRSGEPILQKSLELVNGPARGLAASIDVQPIPATPLVLAHWMTTDFDAGPWHRGAVFELFDERWQSVWRLELPHDYEVDGRPTDERRDEIWTHSPILATGPGRFDLRFVLEEKCVSFEVKREGAAWAVAESGRAPYQYPDIPLSGLMRPRQLSAERDESVPSRPIRAEAGWHAEREALELRDPKGQVLRRIERRPDGQWFRRIHGLAIEADGSLVVLEAWPGQFLGVALADPVLAFYGPAGEPRNVLPLPALTCDSLQVAGERVLIVGFREVHLVDRNNGSVFDLDLGPVVSEVSSPVCQLLASGKELEVVDRRGHQRLRFALEE